MGQVTHVTRHAAIRGHGLLGGVVAVVDSMRTDKSKDAGEYGSREVVGHIIARNWRLRVVDAEMGIVGGGCGVPATFGGETPGATTETSEKIHDASAWGEARETLGLREAGRGCGSLC